MTHQLMVGKTLIHLNVATLLVVRIVIIVVKNCLWFCFFPEITGKIKKMHKKFYSRRQSGEEVPGMCRDERRFFSFYLQFSHVTKYHQLVVVVVTILLQKQ